MDFNKDSHRVPRPEYVEEDAFPRAATALDPGRGEDVQKALDDVGSSVEQLYRVANAFLARRTEEKPYAVLGAAAGVGFVLGGGLASRLGGVVASLGSRMLLSRAVNRWLASIGQDEAIAETE